VEQKWKMKVHLKSPHEGNPFHESRFTPCVKEFGVESFPNISQYYNLIASTGIHVRDHDLDQCGLSKKT
jgi:hypothetical protein